MTEQTISDNLNEQMDDTEEGEILEDGEIADEDESAISSSGDHKTFDTQKGLNAEEKENNNNRDKDLRDRGDSRKREDRKSEDRNRDKDKDRRSDRDRDRDRRDRYDRSERSERERKSSSTDRDRRDNERDRKTSSATTEDERRRKERDRKRRRSDEDEKDDRQKDSDKRKRGQNRDQNWNEYNNNESNNNRNNNNNNNNFNDFERRPFEDFDFRMPQTQGFASVGPMHERDLNDDDDSNFDERDFEEMLQIMGNGMPFNRMGAMNGNDKRSMMKAMALMMKRNLNSDKLRQLDRLRDKRRPNDRQPGPTGTRAPLIRPPERQTPFKQICKYFLEGKCHKGPDCPFSHDAMPPKKKELCKFYLQGFCGKGEDCLFMHSEFPCKFFHTNVECYSGDKCRFSHNPLTEETREILRNYLDSGTLPDDPKPDRQHRHSDIDKNTNRESHNQNNLNPSDTQTNSEINSSVNPNSAQMGTSFTPIKPVVKRHALLGDPTIEMKTSHLTWIWQQEMKELEDAYVGNKRNLFCIEKQFVIPEKPPTPRMEDDEDEIEAQIRNYYKDTMPDFEADTDDRKPVANPKVIEEQKLIEASAHDEDLRTLMARPRSHTNESICNIVTNDVDERSQQSTVREEPQLVEVPQNVPKVARDLYLKMQNKLQNETEVKPLDLQSDSDDDDNVLAAALKNVQQSSKQSPTDKISQMLSIIRNSSNTNTNQSPQQSEFWQNIMNGIHIAGVTGSPSSNTTPPRNDFRDPRLKRGKESMSPSVEKTPPVKICDPNVKIEYKLVPIKANDIDYSTYVSIYRIDAHLKNDPRLQKFFSKLPSSEIDSLSRIVPPPLKTAPVTPLSVLKSKKMSEKRQKDSLKDRTDSSILPPLPPLTISPTKSMPTPGIRPPTPPPIMSPLELISSRPTYTVSADIKSQTIEESAEDLVIKPEIKSIPPPLKLSSPPLTLSPPQLISSPPPLTSSSLSTELFESVFESSIDSDINIERDDQKPNKLMKTSAVYSDEEDMYENLYPSQTIPDDLSLVGPEMPFGVIQNRDLNGPSLSTDSDNDLEIDLRQRQDSVSEVESADECELMIASASETEDNNEMDVTNSSTLNDNEEETLSQNNECKTNNISDESNNENIETKLLSEEPMNLTATDVQNKGCDESGKSDHSLKSVFSIIDPTASPFC